MAASRARAVAPCARVAGLRADAGGTTGGRTAGAPLKGTTLTDLLSDLNDRQREAVSTVEGPLLILAGAGSGKTRVITYRIAHLIREGIASPGDITAVTFTNKAAGEMKQRVARLLGGDEAGAWVGTFHGLCLRMLRRDGPLLGYAPGFVIYDTADQLGLLRALMKEMNLDDSAETARSMLHRIGAAKNRLLTMEQVEGQASGPGGELFTRCYRAYQEGLKKNNAVDFDDLLMQALVLFDRYPGIAERYAAACRFLLVDEYQDTNHAQYLLIRALARRHRNVCCVGDEDQSIFSWRGADIQNILDFQSDYTDARLIKLEQNYRSTKTILAAAGAVIANNKSRIGKTLWTENDGGEQIEVTLTPDDRSEAEHVLGQVRGMTRDGRSWGDICILYRTNNQSRLFEEVFLREAIPHRVVGSLRFYERKEIKDIVAWLRVLLNPADDLSLGRILNVPPRGLGKGAVEDLASLAASESVPLGRAIELAVERRALAARTGRSLEQFLGILSDLRQRARESGLLPAVQARQPRLDLDIASADAAMPPSDDGRTSDATARTVRPAGKGVVGLIAALMERIGYSAHLEKLHPGDHEARLENIDALISAAAEYDEEGSPEGLQGFVDRSSLRSDTDDIKEGGGVSLMTVHSAKGLEFPVVVVTGLEEHIFPHVRSSDSESELEEERRLFYVALTRAKERLQLTAASTRRSFGDFVENPMSRFLDELPAELVHSSHDTSFWSIPRPSSSQGTSGGQAWGEGRPVRGRAGPGYGGRPRAGRGGRGRGGGYGPTAAGVSARRGEGGREIETVHYDMTGDDEYAVGMKVSHPMFGRGTISVVEGSGPSLKLTIRFKEAGIRTILPRHTTLVIGN